MITLVLALVCWLTSTSLAQWAPPRGPVRPMQIGQNPLPAPQAAPTYVAPSRPNPDAQAGPPTPQIFESLAEGHAICVLIGEGVLNRFVTTDVQEAGPIEEIVLGARILGSQQTNARTRLECLPQSNAARCVIVLDGVTQNQTISYTQQAAIRSQGNYRFQVSKQLEFDGQAVKTWSPATFLTIDHRNVGATTTVNNVPVIGPLARQIALNTADQHRPMAEQVAAARITDTVGPRFNDSLDEEITSLNRLLTETVYPQLQRLNAWPSLASSQSTHDAILLGARLTTQPPAERLSAPLPRDRASITPGGPQAPQWNQGGRLPTRPVSLQAPPAPESQVREQLWIALHESLVASAAERSPLPGLQLPDRALMQLLQGEFPLTATDAELATLVFDSKAPLRAEMRQGELLLEARVAFRTALGVEIPAQRIQIALTPALTAGEVRLRPELRKVEPWESGGNAAIAAMAENVIRQAIEPQLRELHFPARYDVPRAGQPPVGLQVTSLHCDGGWFFLSLSPADPPPAAQSPPPDRSGPARR